MPNKKTSIKSLVVLIGVAATIAGFQPKVAAADDYPNRVVQLIVPYPPGGGVDTVGRVIAQKLTDALGQNVIVVNRPGAGSVIGVRDGAKAAPDGYTILMLVTGASLPANTGYDLQKDFAPIGLIASIPIVIMANPSVPVKSMSDIVALAKQKPGTLTVGTPPSPTLNYFGAVQFKNMTGIDVTIVTYKGTGPLTTDLLGGHIKYAFNTLPPALGNVRAGQLRAIAVADRKRVAILPDVPTADESGLPGFEAVVYYGLLAPAGTPKDIVARLNAEINKIVTQPDFRARLRDDGADVSPMTVDQFTAFVKAEGDKYLNIIKQSGVKPE
jgi:tripartite-type tricarboxylate transporter receptor subunit TctC